MFVVVDESGSEFLISPQDFDDLKKIKPNSDTEYFGDLSLWQRADSVEYRQLLDLHSGKNDQHSVFISYLNGTRFLVPALVLITAMFRPRNKLLKLLFNLDFVHQSLNSAFDAFGQLEKVVLQGALSMVERDEVETLLTFCMSFAGGQRLLRSMGVHAGIGAISMDLPHFYASLMLHGVRCGDDVCVTSIEAKSLSSLERPLPYASRTPRAVKLTAGGLTGVGAGNIKTLPFSDLSDATDSEWNLFGDELIQRASTASSAAVVREYVNCEFERCRMAQPRLTYRNRDAMRQINSWTQSGAWQRFVNALRAAREPHSRSGCGYDHPVDLGFLQLHDRLMVLSSEQGYVTTLPFSNRYAGRRIKSCPDRNTFTSHFSAWTDVAATTFFDPLGIDASIAKDHPVKAIELRDVRYLFSTAALIRALFPSSRILERYLIGEVNLEDQVEHIPGDGRIERIQPIGKSEYLSVSEQFLQMCASFPSMQQMLEDVRSGLVRGTTQFMLPDAAARFTVGGIRIGKDFLVTALTIDEFVITDLSFERFPNAARTFTRPASLGKAALRRNYSS